MKSDVSNFKKLIVVGDRLLVKPTKQSDKTSSGLFLPPGVQEKENIQKGYVIKVGPGHPIPCRWNKKNCGKAKRK